MSRLGYVMPDSTESPHTGQSDCTLVIKFNHLLAKFTNGIGRTPSKISSASYLFFKISILKFT